MLIFDALQCPISFYIGRSCRDQVSQQKIEVISLKFKIYYLDNTTWRAVGNLMP